MRFATFTVGPSRSEYAVHLQSLAYYALQSGIFGDFLKGSCKLQARRDMIVELLQDRRVSRGQSGVRAFSFALTCNAQH